MHRFDPANAEKLDDPRRMSAYSPECLIHDASLQTKHDVLDLGCGTGYFTVPLARYLTGNIYAVDLSVEMLDIVQQKSLQHKLDNVEAIVGDAQGIPLLDSCVDRVICSLLIHECDDVSQVIREIKRVMRRQGVVLILEWSKKQTKLGPSIEYRVDETDLVERMTDLGFICEVRHPNRAQYVLIATEG